MGNRLIRLEKVAYLAIGFAATLFFILAFNNWQSKEQGYFSFTGKLGAWIAVLLVGTVATGIIQWLWKWEIRSVFRHGKPKQDMGAEPLARRHRRYR